MSRVAGLRRAMFARHANPWSAWTRWATTPLVVVPVWTRRWSHAAAVAVWFAVNPVIFPEPAHRRAWSTRAILGEERWSADRPRDAGLVLNAVASVALSAALVAARRRRLRPTVAATALAMAVTLGYWALMVRYYDRRAGSGG